jgi:quercetin dioxygenase-like cupin family protein
MKKAPKAFAIKLDKGQRYLRILSGPPQNRALRSGLVCLAPGESVGQHDTGDHEELVIVLEGRGKMQGRGGSIRMNGARAAYCPPHTEHDVVNTGSGPLRYIYIVTKAQ